jgi:hypothetical protein
MTVKQFEEINLFSNKNVEKIVSSIVNESSNAALVSMYEDSVILLDHDDGQFYSADYAFDGKSLKLTLENFQSIDLEKEESSFKKDVSAFFESDETSVKSLTESYKNSVMEQEKFVNELISEALSTKDFNEKINYKELSEANDSITIADKPYFKAYVERLETNPLNEVKFFNWKDKVIVSLMESEKVKLINSSAVEKANELWKKENFKSLFGEAASIFIEDVDQGKEKLVSLFEEYPQLFLLDNADRKTLFGKAIISNSRLRESLEDLQKGMDILFETEEIRELQSSYMSLLEESDDDSEDETSEEEPADDTKEETPAKELDADEVKEIADSLQKIADEVEDEKLKGKLDDIIAKLGGSIEEGTRPNLIKEAIYLLTI